VVRGEQELVKMSDMADEKWRNYDEDEDLYGSDLARCKRFENCVERLGIEDGSKIVEIGAGRGDFKRYIDEETDLENIEYIGYDPYLQDQSYDGIEVLDMEAEIEELEEMERADYYVSIGVFVIKQHSLVQDWEMCKEYIERMYRNSSKGVFISLHSAWKQYVKQNHFVVFPEEVLKFGKKLSERVMIDHTYAPHSFSLVLFSEDSELRKYFKDRGWGD